MKATCSKIYRDLPFAHRQWRHDGHCNLIHGHNWEVQITFAANERDPAGFIVDFGKLKGLKAWIDDKFDHTLVLAKDDPMLTFGASDIRNNAKVTIVDDCSCEGLAEWLFHQIGHVVKTMSMGRAWVESVTVREDSKNSATFHRG